MKVIRAHWPAPKNIHAFTTTKCQDFDFSLTVNQQNFSQLFNAPQPTWLQQVHGADYVILPYEYHQKPTADASVTQVYRKVCAVLTADCLPLLLTNQQGTQVAAIHGGWRSLAQDIIAHTVACFEEPEKVLVWLGPAIGPSAFEVGSDVKEIFLGHPKLSVQLASAFRTKSDQKWLLDIFQIAKMQLQHAGVLPHHIFGGTRCTYTEAHQFYSHRRCRDTGRMASVIWMEAP